MTQNGGTHQVQQTASHYKTLATIKHLLMFMWAMRIPTEGGIFIEGLLAITPESMLVAHQIIQLTGQDDQDCRIHKEANNGYKTR